MVGQVLDVDWAIAWIDAVAQDAERRKAEIAELDGYVGDGDLGENLARGFAAAREAVAAAGRPETVGAVLETAASALVSAVGSAAGPLYAAAFRAAGKSCRREVLDSADVVALIAAALHGVVTRGQAEVGEKTMVDAWSPALAAARQAAADGLDAGAVLAAAAAAAQAGSENTASMQATKGRARFLGEKSIGHRDPGAESVAMVIAAAARTASPAAAS